MANSGHGLGNDIVRGRIIARILGEETARAGLARADDDDHLRQLLLITEAMWSLLSERTGVTVADLRTRMAEIDAVDGAVDGRRGPTPPSPCPSCGAMVDRTRSTCAFCGAEVPGRDPFDAV
jgi:hypothetical protein